MFAQDLFPFRSPDRPRTLIPGTLIPGRRRHMADEEHQEEQLGRSACLALLGSKHFGRLVADTDEPVVVPVNFALRGEALIVRTDREARVVHRIGSTALFESDIVDERRSICWSVIAEGLLEDVTSDLADDSDLRAELEPWAGGPKECWLRLTIDKISGRLVRGPDRRAGVDGRGYL
jgi:hypothetical protein